MLVRVGVGWAASLVGYLAGRVLIMVVGPVAGWFNLLFVLFLPVLSALVGTIVMPPAWLRGVGGVLRHGVVVVPVPLVFAVIAVITGPVEIVTGSLVLMLVGVTVVGALLGRFLRRDPERAMGGSY